MPIYVSLTKLKKKAGQRESIVVDGDKLGFKFPLRKIARDLVNGKYAKNIGIEVPIYMAAVLEYLTAEVLELAGNAAKAANKDSISSLEIELPVTNDEELHKLFGHLTILGDDGEGISAALNDVDDGAGPDKTAIVGPVVLPPADQTPTPLFMDED